MLTVVIAIGCGAAAGWALFHGGVSGPGWSVFWGVLTGAAAQFGIGFLVRRRVQAAMDGVQAILQDGQQRLQHKVNQWQHRPPGSVKQAQQALERDQNAFIDKALAATDALARFRPWSPMLDRQVATLRMQLNYQRQRFDEVDRLMPKCLMLDPMSMAMKMARMFVREAPTDAIAKLFKKSTRRMRYGQGAMLYALFAWILVRRDDVDEAHKVLIKGCERMENDILKRNRDHLANNRVKQFSNAGFGDEWYALGLEQPKVRVRRQRAAPGRYF